MKRHVVSLKSSRQWQGIPAIERAANGRLWCAFFSGGPREPDPANHILLTTSADEGVTWTPPAVVVDPPGATRAYDPGLWHDPTGKLWLFYNEANLETRTFDLWATTTRQSDREEPTWSAPTRLAIDAPFAFRLNKPTVLRTGRWVLPVTWAREAPTDWFAGERQLQGVAVSDDQGGHWALHGAVEAPHWALENMIVERREGDLWMLIRTGGGVLWQSVSADGGEIWSPGAPTGIVNPGARFFVRRLASGKLLLINTPDAARRTGLRAWWSDADGEDWSGPGLELDPRDAVSYPDAVEAPDGTLYAVHDHDRQGAGEILLDIFKHASHPITPRG